MKNISTRILASTAFLVLLNLTGCDISINSDSDDDAQAKFLNLNMGMYQSVFSNHAHQAQRLTLIIDKQGAFLIENNDRDETISYQASFVADDEMLIFDDKISCARDTSIARFSCSYLAGSNMNDLTSLPMLAILPTNTEVELTGSYQGISQNQKIVLDVAASGQISAQYNNCKISGQLAKSTQYLSRFTDSCETGQYLAYVDVEQLSDEQFVVKLYSEHPMLEGYWF